LLPYLSRFAERAARRENVPAEPPVSRELLAQLLADQRSANPVIDEALYARLDLRAYGCVLTRRAGRSPSSDAIHRYMEALANNIPLRRVLGQAAAALAAAGVQAIVYKGQDYLERIYGELGARPMADVDLLVRDDQLGRAEHALLAAGFIADRDCRLMHERKFCKDGLAIDLHHALLQPARMAVAHAELFERALPCTFVKGLLVLEASDALLVHCINQTVKGYHLPPSSYLELQALLAHADVEAVLDRARRYRANSALYTSLKVLGELGHRAAAALAKRVAVSAERAVVLDAVVARFALGSILREQPNRATMLTLKATLIDDAIEAARFVPRWFAAQLPFTSPRALRADLPHGDRTAPGLSGHGRTP
jgi:hypothetical protein